jgi:excisionase family DNA binding protein
VEHAARNAENGQGATEENVAVAPLLLRIPEAAGALGIGRTTLYKLIGEGRIRVVHVGRSSRISLAELQAFVARLPDGARSYAEGTFPRVTALRGPEATFFAGPPEALEL